VEPLSFASPLFLAGLALIPVVVVLYVRGSDPLDAAQTARKREIPIYMVRSAPPTAPWRAHWASRSRSP
jgi:hypothetical protein